jgi:hypothetical protein
MMEVVSGIGGLFSRARDPRRLGRCCQEHLGFPARLYDPEGHPIELWDVR